MITLKTALDVPMLDRVPMSRDESVTFVRCCAMDTDATDETVKQIAGSFISPMPFILAVLLKRLEVHGSDMTFRRGVVMWLACMSNTPGKAVMWAFYLVKRTRSLGRAVTMADVAEDFPYGFPSDEAMSELWDDQKGYKHGRQNDNLLDTAEPWAAESAS